MVGLRKLDLVMIIEVLSITKLFRLYQVVLYTDFLNLCRFGEKLSIKNMTLFQLIAVIFY